MAIDAREETRRQSREVGNAITLLHRTHYGRGANTSRTVYERNFLTVYMEDIYTPAERTLIANGQQEEVKKTRQVFQMAMRESFVEAVKRITGRRVAAFMSQVHFDPDMATEVFVLEPSPEDAASRNGDGDGVT